MDGTSDFNLQTNRDRPVSMTSQAEQPRTQGFLIVCRFAMLTLCGLLSTEYTNVALERI
jgi:hypothetical protein